MPSIKTILSITGSASKGSLNQMILANIASLAAENVKFNEFDLMLLPHFNPTDSIDHPPAPVVEFRQKIEEADGVIICTPEYIFSIPALLKNALEWCVATTVFSNKPVALITASSSGVKAHEQLQLIMNTVGATFTNETTLLISGAKSKLNIQGEFTDEHTKQAIITFANSFVSSLSSPVNPVNDHSG